MKRVVLVVQSVILYGAVALLLWGSTTKGWNLPVLDLYWWILLPGILIVKDVFLFVQGGRVESVELRRMRRHALGKDSDRGVVPQWYKGALVARIYLFPTFLTVYLLYLLIEQTQVWELHTSLIFLGSSKLFLLIATLITGVVMLFGEQYDKKYERMDQSVALGWAYFAMTVCLSLVGGYIVLQQVIELKGIGMVIANIVVVLLYLVGVLLMEEEDDILETKP